METFGLIFIVSTALAAAGFVVVAVLWLKKLRDALALALGETAGRQVRAAQRFEETIAQLQRQQQAADMRLQTLTEANIKMRQDLNALTSKLTVGEGDPQPPSSRILH